MLATSDRNHAAEDHTRYGIPYNRLHLTAPINRRWTMNTMLRLLPILFLTPLLCLAARDAPSGELNGQDLKAACQRALKHDFSGLDGQFCAWYVTPCACDIPGPEDEKAICLPVAATAEQLARDVIQGLEESPELLPQSPAMAAETILARKYPCGARAVEQ